ncbi:MAG TPA: FAD-binding protein [Candidatus Binatia bacterium]|nr:FAD-binding protein [Candidatus Binatia bacterium]
MPQVETPGSPHWFSAVEAPERVARADAVRWDAEADLVVVGYGGAGVAAALAAAEGGLSVTALDLADGGGSTAINGGIVYAGGGTVTQKQAGVEDSSDAMFEYLRGETQGVVSDATLRRFCDGSVEMMDWLARHGVRFDATHYPHKTSYPPPGYHLYHSDSSLVASRAAIARPAARGHKVWSEGSAKVATGFGKAMTGPLQASAVKAGVRFEPYSEVRRLLQDDSGRVIGVGVLQFPENSEVLRRYAQLQAQATKFVLMLPPAFPLAGLTLAIAGWYRRRAQALESQRVLRRIRARRGVCLAAGGFVFNPRMVGHYAPKYRDGMPLGNPGDDGSGIRLGQSAGGATRRMSHMSAWRFIRPPAGLTWGVVVNGRGARFTDETVYGAAIGFEMIEHHGGKAWIVLDQALYDEVLRQVKSKDLYSFQSGPAMLALRFARNRAATLDGLATACGFDAATFRDTVARYNAAAAGQGEDAFGKSPDDRRPIAQAPFYAVDISVTSRLFPLPILSLGGLAVDEGTGAVQRDNGSAIPGLYAAGRNAIGVCSHLYVSGLSVADCIFSGRRAAASAVATHPIG